MSNLPPVGLALYNNFAFSEMAETTALSVRPVYSQDGRTITHSVVSIEIQDYIASTIAADTISTAMVTALTQPAAGFIYNGRGTGAISINTGGPGFPQDVVWGPKPRMLEMKTLGGGNAIRFKWGVDVAIPTCEKATYNGNIQPMEFNYKLAFEIDRSGYSTRRYSGFVKIPQTRLTITNRVPYTSADAWRESINPPMVPGFRRIPGSFTLSDDRNRLDFEIVDEQFRSPNALPPGCMEGDVQHTFNSKPSNVLSWSSTISATYEIAAGLSPNVAITPFMAMAADRIQNAAKMMAPGFFFGRKAGGAGFFPIQFSVAETKVHDKPTVALSMTYTVVEANLGMILANGGLFRPVPNSNAKLWATSVSQILGPRGIAGLAFNPKDDAILDLCVVAPPETPTSIVDLRAMPVGGKHPGPPSPPLGDAELRGNAGAANLISSVFPTPTSARSWVEYVCWLSVETDSGVIVGSTLPPSPLAQGLTSGVWQPLLGSSLPAGALETTFFPQAADVGIGNPGSQNNQPPNSTFAQQRVAPIVYVTLHGYALRAGFQIPIPQLLNVGGMTATPCGRVDRGEGVEQTAIGNIGVPLYFARWKLRYVLTPGVPSGSFDVPGNQLLGA